MTRKYLVDEPLIRYIREILYESQEGRRGDVSGLTYEAAVGDACDLIDTLEPYEDEITAERQAREAAERQRDAALAALRAQQEHEDWLLTICTLRTGPKSDDEIEAALNKSAALNMRAVELRRAVLASAEQPATSSQEQPCHCGRPIITTMTLEDPWCAGCAMSARTCDCVSATSSSQEDSDANG